MQILVGKTVISINRELNAIQAQVYFQSVAKGKIRWLCQFLDGLNCTLLHENIYAIE